MALSKRRIREISRVVVLIIIKEAMIHKTAVCEMSPEEFIEECKQLITVQNEADYKQSLEQKGVSWGELESLFLDCYSEICNLKKKGRNMGNFNER